VLASVTTFVRSALPAPPARVLEVGAGSGELAVVLAGAGYDVVAIDPAGGPAPVRAVALHELDAPAGSFDAAVAVLSLHHVEPLEDSCRRLGELVRPGGVLVIDECDVERFDVRAARWQIEQRGLNGHETHQKDPDELVAMLRAHLHPWDRMRAALDEWFSAGEPVRGPYLHRWELPPGLRDDEEALIAAGRLPATGARLVATRRTGPRSRPHPASAS
jgi:SAM-dependent methyltransferase